MCSQKEEDFTAYFLFWLQCNLGANSYFCNLYEWLPPYTAKFDIRKMIHDYNIVPFLSFYCIIFYIFVVEYKRINMNKPKNRIKEVLEEKGIKQTWLAEKLGKSFCIVNSYVCNRRQPSLDVLFEIAIILQVNPKDLIE